MLRIISLVFCVLISTFIFSQSSAQWRGENRDGIYNETGLLTEWPTDGPKLLWHYDELGPGHSSAAIANGKIYIGGVSGEDGFVIALSMAGNEVWKTVYGKEWIESWDGIRSTPTINDGRVYIMSGYGLVSCLDAESGDIIWQVDLFEKYAGENIKWGITENLLIDGNKLICTPGGKVHNIVALDKNTGNLIWSSAAKTELTAYCSPQLVDHNGKIMVITHTESSVVAVDAYSGDLLWSFPWPNQWSVHPNTPYYKDGKLFITSGYGQGCALLEISPMGNSVRKIWENKSLDNQMGGFVVLDGKIYGAGQKSHKWLCLDWKTGNELYSSTDVKVGNIIAAENMLYWYGQDGNVALVEPTNNAFNIKGKFKVPYGRDQHWAHSVIANKWLFVRHGTSLMVYDIAK